MKRNPEIETKSTSCQVTAAYVYTDALNTVTEHPVFITIICCMWSNITTVVAAQLVAQSLTSRIGKDPRVWNLKSVCVYEADTSLEFFIYQEFLCLHVKKKKIKVSVHCFELSNLK